MLCIPEAAVELTDGSTSNKASCELLQLLSRNLLNFKSKIISVQCRIGTRWGIGGNNGLREKGHMAVYQPDPDVICWKNIQHEIS